MSKTIVNEHGQELYINITPDNDGWCFFILGNDIEVEFFLSKLEFHSLREIMNAIDQHTG